ncbi:MAG: fucose isomerase [Chloroflexi bacterium HGW-Chloroflexi-10]|nr:MAG: fucose isomerase [Chloroflexi bacterium HGW-Chloroflexi-10]
MKSTLGVILSSRDFFPAHLVTQARSEVLEVLGELGINSILLNEDQAIHGAVQTYQHSRMCADLFKAHRDEIDGILVVLPNFGDEKAVADTIKFSGLNVPILVQAYPDDLSSFDVSNRRDSFCGKISVCSNLRQYGYSFSVTDLHTVTPKSNEFKKDLIRFLGVCRVVRGLRSARLGAVGARPNAFNTVRYSEKLLQETGITVLTADLSEILGPAAKLKNDDVDVINQLDQIMNYLPTKGVPNESIMRMAKFSTILKKWMADLDIQATALQCWNSLQTNYGVNVCTLMSMMSESLMPSACEVDITGVVSMYGLQLATGTPSALVDWNNNYGDDPDKCVLFHCGNWAKSFTPDARMEYANILATTLGKENTYGAINGRTPSGRMSFARVTTDDQLGMIRAYVGEGEFTDDVLDTFGSRAVIKVPQLQDLLKYIVKNGFEHHVAMSGAPSAQILSEALGTYMGWEVYNHGS